MFHLIPAVLAILPSAYAAPLSARQSCTATTTPGPFIWTVENFDFHASYIFTTPAHQNSWGYVNFNLSNPAVPFTVPCSGQSDQLEDFFYGTQSFNCALPPDAPHGSGPTSFTFSRPNNRLTLKQQWTCYDRPADVTTFTGSGAVNLTLSCTDTMYTNPNWTMGQIYSDREIKCAPVTVPVNLTEISAVA